ncbi:MAG: hypothetical protein LBP59_06550 [Planctomycetaceae bacterium]|nr:hypothetical protein [Planctomycetaceae bacterium]
MGISIQYVLEIQRLKSVKACRTKARQAKVNANSSTNSLKIHFFVKKYAVFRRNIAIRIKRLLNFNNS